MQHWHATRIIVESRVVAVIRTDTSAAAVTAGRALLSGGLRAIEVALTTPDGLDAITDLARGAPPGTAVGAGTVLDAATAAAAARAGAAFVVSPGLDPATVAAAHRYGMAALPGAASATEVVRALEAGSDLVKLFPASALGMDTVRALGTALPQAPLVPTGGIEIADVPAWLEAGAVAVGLGGRLVADDPHETERRARQLVKLLG